MLFAPIGPLIWILRGRNALSVAAGKLLDRGKSLFYLKKITLLAIRVVLCKHSHITLRSLQRIYTVVLFIL